MTIIVGPYCFVCGGTNVIDRMEKGTIAWTEQGAVEGMVKRTVCLDCDAEPRAEGKEVQG